MNKNLAKKIRRKRRVRKSIISKSNHLRLSINRSCKHIYVQLIDDQKDITLASENDFDLNKTKLTKQDKAIKVGEKIAAKINKLKIKQVVVDRGCNKYTGRVKALVEQVRKSGIKI